MLRKESLSILVNTIIDGGKFEVDTRTRHTLARDQANIVRSLYVEVAIKVSPDLRLYITIGMHYRPTSKWKEVVYVSVPTACLMLVGASRPQPRMV